MTRIVPPLLTSVHPAPPALRYWMARRIIRCVTSGYAPSGHSLLQFGLRLARG
jgi:hypothetical protein